MTHKTILVVEDEPALLEAVKLKLSQVGVTVLTASSGEAALEVLKDHKPDLVWLDLLLPGINGLEVLNHIRTDLQMPHLPVVIVSVSGGPEKVKRAFELNVLDYIIKSDFKIEDIIHKVMNLLRDDIKPN